MILATTVNDGTTGLLNRLRGTLIGSGSSGASTQGSTTYDGGQALGSDGLGVIAGDMLHIIGVGVFVISATPGESTNTLTLKEAPSVTASSQKYQILRGGLSENQIVDIHSNTSGGHVILYDPFAPYMPTGSSIHQPSDLEPTEVFAQATFPVAMTATDWIEIRGFTHIEWHVTGSSYASITGLKYRIEYCYAVNNNAYQPSLSAEHLDTSGSSPVVKQIEYEVQVDNIFPGKEGYGIVVPVHGRFMRLVFMGTGASSAGSDTAAVTAYRRTS